MSLPTPPVLLIAFNRPAQTRQVFAAIRSARPSRLYVACDGPRAGKAGEREKVLEVRALVREVDWPCEVRTRFLEQNAGCGLGVSAAIDWFLGEAGEGIILEDDCVPEPAFFRFAAIMLERHRHEPRVGLISGSKMAPAFPLEASHGFSRIPACWGWATWRRAWEGYEVRPSEVSADEPWTKHLHRNTARRLIAALARLRGPEVHTWDYQLMLHQLRRDMLTVVPNDNLVLNIGFDGSGTHFSGQRRPWWVPHAAFDVAENWTDRPTIAPHAGYDRYFQAVAHGGSSRLRRAWIKCRRLLRRIFLPHEA